MEVMIIVAIAGIAGMIYMHYFDKNYDKNHPQQH